MPSRRVNVISHCARSPWFEKTWNEQSLYTEYAGRLVLQSMGQDRVDEYWHLRKKACLYDVPEKPLEIRGRDAVAFLDRAFTRPVDRLRVGRGSYGLLCDKHGGLVCDGILFRRADDCFWYVHADADVQLWLSAIATDFEVEVGDPGAWVLQVQGPASLQVLASACDSAPPGEFRYFDAFDGHMGGQPVMISRTGWTGELGFEVYNLARDVDGPALWDHLLAAGAEFDLRAGSQVSMNLRRIEAGILNYPTDMDRRTTPYDMGLGAFVDLDSHDFIGREALRAAPRENRFTGFKCASRQIPFGARLQAGGREIGRVTAFEVSPYLDSGVGFALLDSPEFLDCGDVVVTDRAGESCALELVTLPFYDAEKNIPRGLPSAHGFAD